MPEDTRVEILSLQSDPRKFREVRNWLAGIARQEGFDELDTQELAVAVSEACANIHRHAYEGRVDGRIEIQVEVECRIMRLTVKDFGITFNPADYEPPDLTVPSENGYGIYLMRNLMDHVEHHRIDGGTRLVMIKQNRSSIAGDLGNRRSGSV